MTHTRSSKMNARRTTPVHKRFLWSIIALLLMLGSLAGCASLASRESSLPTPPAPDAATAARYQHGRTMYARKCGRCHELFDPAEYAAREWPGYVKRYGPRAGLKIEDRGAVTEYLQACAAP
ncbi:hypothetical protein ANRL1_04619 [Anaerolineae bacterium]|nr:hypothetical protein ANRL1_04619 [Anaerolineae bacterium]